MLSYEHGNKNGTGSRLCIETEMSPNGESGRVRFEIHGQTDMGNVNPADGKWEFADDNPAIVSLSVTQVAHIIPVLRGEAQGILKGSGLVVKEEGRTSLLHLDAETKPYRSFAMHIKTSWANGDKAEGRILLNPTEGLALLAAIEGTMGRLAFGNANGDFRLH